jgi:hypothetical protein
MLDAPVILTTLKHLRPHKPMTETVCPSDLTNNQKNSTCRGGGGGGETAPLGIIPNNIEDNLLTQVKKTPESPAPPIHSSLGIHNLILLGWALRIRWLWANKTDPSRPWAGLPIQIPQNAQPLFNVAVDAIVGNGEKILFWKDRWLDGRTIAEIAPNLVKSVHKQTAKRRTVAQALLNRKWVADIKGALTVKVLE